MATVKNKPEYVRLWIEEKFGGSKGPGTVWHEVVPAINQTGCGIPITCVHAATTAPDPDLICINCEKGKSRRTR